MNLRKPHDPEQVPNEWFEGRMRHHRDRLLAKCDWTQTNDAPVDREVWATYRQQLRDFPSTWTPAETADFPEPPQ